MADRYRNSTMLYDFWYLYIPSVLTLNNGIYLQVSVANTDHGAKCHRETQLYTANAMGFLGFGIKSLIIS
jgi:hypothetical protein